MSRCIRTAEDERLEVHHKDRDGGNGLKNAQVLCQTCHEKTPTYGKEGKSPPEFSLETRYAALKRAGYRCECERDGCAHPTEEDREINEVLMKRFPC